MRREPKGRQREDRRLNLFWSKNKTFPTQFGGDEETLDAKKRSHFGGASTIKKSAKDRKKTETTDGHSEK